MPRSPAPPQRLPLDLRVIGEAAQCLCPLVAISVSFATNVAAQVEVAASDPGGAPLSRGALPSALVGDQGQRRCIFCGNIADDKEHLLPEWLQRILPPDQPVIHYREVGGVKTPPWEKKPFREKAKFVCKACNHGWMSDLETATKPLLTPAITRQGPCDLDLLAQWTSHGGQSRLASSCKRRGRNNSRHRCIRCFQDELHAAADGDGLKSALMRERKTTRSIRSISRNPYGFRQMMNISKSRRNLDT